MMPPETPGDANGRASSRSQVTRPGSSVFSIPLPVKRLFDKFPLVTYAPNDLPHPSSGAGKGRGHVLFLWTAHEDASERVASFNPNCLKWQAFLTSQNVRFHVVASNNHASTSERLPLLIPDHQHPAPFKGTSPLSAHQLAKWTITCGDSWPMELDLQYEAYMSLLDGPIRRAWLYHMYLTPNFDKFTVPSYIGTQSSSAFIRIINAWELRSAARAELKKHSPVVDADGLYQDADQAFAALENVLKRKNRMADAENRAPSLLEATAFAYLFLLLETLYTAWADTRLVDVVRKYPELEKVEVALNASHFGALKPPQLYLR